VKIVLEAAAPMSKLNPATVEDSGVPAPSFANWSMRALSPENSQTNVAEVRAAMPAMPAEIATQPPVIDLPKIAFLNLAGTSCATIVAEDRAVIGELFGRNVQVTTVPIPCDVLFLYCSFDPSGRIVGQQETVRSLIRDSEARVAVIASQVPTDLLSNREFQAALAEGDNPPVNLVMTLNRNGENFGGFFKSLFQMMWTGVPMPMAWVQLAPQGPNQRDDIPGTICLMEAGQIAFATGARSRS
jgi:ribosomal protein L30E